MSKFNSLRVSAVTKETKSAVVIEFDLPTELEPSYIFQAGQYLTLEHLIAGEKVRRSYSICSAPFEKELKVLVKEVEGGKFSTYANSQIKVNDQIDVMTPNGNFVTDIDSANGKSYALFAAGSGITPVISIIKELLNSSNSNNISLFYVNKTSEDVMFKEELEGLKNKYMNRFSLHHFLTREKLQADLFCGRIDKAKCADLTNKFLSLENTDEYFICGPERMILDVSEYLSDNGVDKKSIHFELFTTSAGSNEAVEVQSEELDSNEDSIVEVILDGDTVKFELNASGESILDQGIINGLDLPYSCKGGVCCTCKAKVLKGTVVMEKNYALEEEEVEEGFVLACQCHPTSKEVVLSFDDI